jgi:hypothetical protein
MMPPPSVAPGLSGGRFAPGVLAARPARGIGFSIATSVVVCLQEAGHAPLRPAVVVCLQEAGHGASASNADNTPCSKLSLPVGDGLA